MVFVKFEHSKTSYFLLFPVFVLSKANYAELKLTIHGTDPERGVSKKAK